MGKVLNALKTANGDIPDLVLRCLDDAAETPAPRPPSRRSGATVIEPIFDKPSLVELPPREDFREDDWPPALDEVTVPEIADDPEPAIGRRVSLRVSDSSPLLSSSREDRRAAEQYRIIRTRIFHHLAGSSITVISSPGMGDGKTVTSVNLAAALAYKGEDRVILVDADLRLSKVHERLGISKTPGLAEVLAGTCTLEQALLQVEQLPNFFVLPAGNAETNPTELLDSSNWRVLLARLRNEFRRTIIDSPPADAVADFDLIAASCDGVVLVVRPDHTSRPLLMRALAKVKGKLTGVLINDVEDWFLWKRESPSYQYYRGGARTKSPSKAAGR